MHKYLEWYVVSYKNPIISLTLLIYCSINSLTLNQNAIFGAHYNTIPTIYPIFTCLVANICFFNSCKWMLLHTQLDLLNLNGINVVLYFSLYAKYFLLHKITFSHSQPNSRIFNQRDTFPCINTDVYFEFLERNSQTYSKRASRASVSGTCRCFFMVAIMPS